MNKYLFTLTISSIHSYISQARKAKDLYAGSHIVSCLIKDIIEKRIDGQPNIERVIPADTNIVSNKIVLVLNNKDDKDIKKFGQELENSINRYFSNLVFKTTKNIDDSSNNFFDIHWVGVKLDDRYEDGYKNSYKELENSLGIVKNVRKFKQFIQKEGIKKCILCGERNYILEDTKTTNEKKDKLCLICATKRIIKLENTISSTADIVLLDKNIKYNDAQKYLEENPNQNKHYAMIHLDIDSLGKKLSTLNQDKQNKLSKNLSNFAKSIESEILSLQDGTLKGKVIYAGGDDFLGLVNLSYLFEVIKELYEKFENIKKDENLTFSISIVIAHYKSPLHKVLDYSRQLLKDGKEFFEDKNALAIMTINQNTITSKTIIQKKDFDVLGELKDKDIASNLYFKLKNTFAYLEEMSYDEFLTQKKMIKTEIKRLLEKSQKRFDKNLYEDLISVFDNQSREVSTNRYKIDLDNFIGYLKSLEQLKKVTKDRNE